MKDLQHSVIVVPEGIAADEFGRTKNEVSFVYKAVLDFVIKNHGSDFIYLAPANKFDSDFAEQELAGFYLNEKNFKNYFVATAENQDGYIDTLGNAVFLKESLIEKSLWPIKNAILVCAEIHARRAEMCFKSVGFEIKKLERVKYKIDQNNFIVSRLFYYKHKGLHVVYEALAFIRDFIRIKLKFFGNFLMRKTIASIIQAIFCDKSLPYSYKSCDFTLLQIKKSPAHINFALKFLTFGFLLLSIFYGIGRPFFFYKSNYKKIRFIAIFENLSKTSRMFISFIRSMSLIYTCDNELI